MKKKVSNKKEGKIFQKIENLALITDKGFDRIQKQFESVHRKLDGHDKNFESVHRKLDGHDKNFESVHKEIENLALITGKGFESVHKKLGEHDQKFDDVDGQLKVIVNELMRLGDEVKDIKGTTMDLVHMSADQDKENRKIIFRLDHLENRVVTR